MKNILEKLARMPRLINCYKKIRHIVVSGALLLFAIPFFLYISCFNLLSSFAKSWYFLLKKSTENEYIDAKNYSLNEDKIEKIIDCWINCHRDKFDSIEKKPVTISLKNLVHSYLEISLHPKNQKSLPLKFEIGGQVQFVIRIERIDPKKYVHGFEFDTENSRGYDNINAEQLENILACYLEVNYYARDLMIDEKVIASEFHLKSGKVDYVDYFGDPCFFEKIAATQKQFKFEHL